VSLMGQNFSGASKLTATSPGTITRHKPPMCFSSIVVRMSSGYQKRNVPGQSWTGSQMKLVVPGESVREQERHPGIGTSTKGCAGQQQRNLGSCSCIVISEVINGQRGVRTASIEKSYE
jgi:hypothetical protein